jgi:hypothetical protein
MQSTQRFMLSSGIIFREDDDGAFLFNPDTGNLKYMNRLAKETFMMIEDGKDIDQLINYILELYPDIDLDQIRKDVGSFILELRTNHFISCLVKE